MATDATMQDRAATRVADAQRQAADTLRITVGFVAAAALAVVLPHDTGMWLPLHLFLVGGVVTAIAAATQLLAVTWSAAPAPAEGVVRLQRWCLAGGAVAVAGGRELGLTAVTAVGGAAVAVGMAVLASSLLAVRRSGRTDRFRPAIDAYLAGITCALAGVPLGVFLAVADPSTWWVRLRAAHLTLNLFGLVGLVIAGTLPFFVATQARTRMAPAATPQRIRLVVGAMAGGVAVTALGQLADRTAVVVTGRLSSLAALVAVLSLLPRVGHRQLRWAGPRLVQLATGVAWWIVAVGLLVLDDLGLRVAGDPLHVFAVGAVAQILVASLAYFGPVLRGGGHERLAAGFRATSSWASLALGNLAALSVLLDLEAAAGVVVVAWTFEVLRCAARFAIIQSEREGVTT